MRPCVAVVIQLLHGRSKRNCHPHVSRSPCPWSYWNFVMNALLQRYNVGRRLTLAFGLLILLSCSLVAAGVATIAKARSELDGIVNVNIEKIRLWSEMLDANSSISIALRDLSMAKDADEIATAKRTIDSERLRYDTNRDVIFATKTDAQGMQNRAQVSKQREIARIANDAIIASAMAGRQAEAQALLMGSGGAAMNGWQKAIRNCVSSQRKKATLAYAKATQALVNGRNTLIAGGVGVVLVSSLLAWLITRSLTQPLERATRAAEAIANGRLDNDVGTQARD
ncbi:MCP four helix bundle domain-containing protein, partial [Xanthomonas graminis]